MDHSMIRIKAKTNRLINLFVSIQTNKSIHQLADRIIQCLYQQDDQDASEQPKEKNVTVNALHFEGFYISKSENVGNILKDGDEISCIFSASKLKQPVSGANAGNIQESRQNKGVNNPCKRQIIENTLRDPFKVEHTQHEPKREMKIQYDQKIKCYSFQGNQIGSQNFKVETQQQKSEVVIGPEKEKKDRSWEQQREEENFKLVQNEKQTDDQFSDSCEDMTKKEYILGNYPNQNSEELSDLRLPFFPSGQSKCVKEQNSIHQSEGSDIVELSFKMNKKRSNSFNKVSHKCVKLQHIETQREQELGIGEEMGGVKYANMSGDLQVNKNEKSEGKAWSIKFEKLVPNEKKGEGIIYCYKKQKQDGEFSKTFIETESSTDSFDLASSIGEQTSLLKEISFTLKAKPQKNIMKYQERHSEDGQ